MALEMPLFLVTYLYSPIRKNLKRSKTTYYCSKNVVNLPNWSTFKTASTFLVKIENKTIYKPKKSFLTYPALEYASKRWAIKVRYVARHYWSCQLRMQSNTTDIAASFFPFYTQKQVQFFGDIFKPKYVLLKQKVKVVHEKQHKKNSNKRNKKNTRTSKTFLYIFFLSCLFTYCFER